jgi:tyramine---L-glutamate ligase
MRDAIVADFAAISDVQVLTLSMEDETDFRALAAAADWALIIAPETDGILEERCRWALEHGAHLLGPSLEAVRLTADKLALSKHFECQRVPHPRTWPLGSEPPNLFPIVWKSRVGAGSQDTCLHHCPSHAPLPRQEGGYIAQEFVNGIAASVAFLIGPESRVPLLPCHQHISDDGRLRYLGGSLPLTDSLSARALRLAESAIAAVTGLFGYVGVDVVLAEDPMHDCVIEINPRLTTSYVGLRQATACNIAETLLRVVRGEGPPQLAWRSSCVEWQPNGLIECGAGF